MSNFKTVENLGYERDSSGYAFMRLLLDGEEARIFLEHKPTLLKAGIVFLGAEWRDRVEPIEFRAPGVTPTTVRGATKDKRVLELYREFVEASNSGRLLPPTS